MCTINILTSGPYRCILINMKRTHIYLTEKQVDKLKQESKNTGLSISEIIRRLVDKKYIDGDVV